MELQPGCEIQAEFVLSIEAQMKAWLVQILFLVAIVLVGFVPSDAATVSVPPHSLWFFFDRAPQSVQLVECRSTTSRRCEQPMPPTAQFQCAETACLYQEPLLSQGARTPVFQLIAQFPGETTARSSPPFAAHFRSEVAGYRDRHFTVKLQNQSLQVEPDDKMKPSRWETFGAALGLTQVSEMTIALLFLSVLKFDRTEMIRVLLWIGLVNLFTFPVAWFFFPSLQSFEYQSTRVFGVFSLFSAIAFSIILLKRKATTATIIRTTILWIFCLPIVLTVAFIAASFFGYAEFFPSAAGIPNLIVLPISALCIFVWQGWLLCRCQSRLTKYQSYLLSLLMNLFGLVLGSVFLPVLQRYR